MTPMAKILTARHNDAIQLIAFVLSIPIQFLIGIQIAKWIV